MGRLIVVSFSTLDGIVEDPSGSDRTPFGGWAMRHGPQAIAGDKFGLGPILRNGTLLFGRHTWDLFKTIWPYRSDAFSQAMNSARKAVVTSRPLDGPQWAHSSAIAVPLTEWATGEVAVRDVVVIGSLAVVDALAGAGLIDEYRLLVFPVVLAAGRGLFRKYLELTLVSAEQVGPGMLAILTVERKEAL